MRLSVHIALYNAEDYFPDCINSVLRCVPEDAEIFILDDASTDASSTIAAQFAARNNRIRFERNPENLGVALTRKKMIESSNAEFILPFDADDIMLPGYFPRALQKLANDPGAVLIYGKALAFNATPNNNFNPIVTIGREASSFSLAFHTPLQHGGTIIRRQALEACGGYLPLPDDLPAEDYYLWTRIIQYGHMLFENRYSFLYRRHERQTTATQKNNYAAALEYARQEALQRNPYLLSSPDHEPNSRELRMFLLGLLCSRTATGTQEYRRTIEEAYRLNPDDYLVCLLMVNCLAESGHPDSALRLNRQLSRQALSPDTMAQVCQQWIELLRVMRFPLDEAEQALQEQKRLQQQEMSHIYRRSREFLSELAKLENQG